MAEQCEIVGVVSRLQSNPGKVVSTETERDREREKEKEVMFIIVVFQLNSCTCRIFSHQCNLFQKDTLHFGLDPI